MAAKKKRKPKEINPKTYTYYDKAEADYMALRKKLLKGKAAKLKKIKKGK